MAQNNSVENMPSTSSNVAWNNTQVDLSEQSQNENIDTDSDSDGWTVYYTRKTKYAIKKKLKAAQQALRIIIERASICNNEFSSYLSEKQVEILLQYDDTLMEGVLRINPKNYRNAYVTTDRSDQDIIINSIIHRNRALEGDVVIISYLESDNNEPKLNEQKRAVVVHIKQKVHNRKCVGVLKPIPYRKNKFQFLPRDPKVPKLNICKSLINAKYFNNISEYENTLFLAKIDHWTDIRFAMGTIECEIGESGDIDSETLGFIATTDLDITSFDTDLYPCYTISTKEYELREDCRKMCILSIDPILCRDIDDAMSCRKLDNGNYEVGVHISDVAHFLTENDILNKKVANKATAIYLVQRTFDMLPDDLRMLCSLSPDADKLTFSIFLEMTVDGEIVNHRFAKSIINSCSQLAYSHAQVILDNSKHAKTKLPKIYNGFCFEDLHQVITMLGKLSVILRNRRLQGGALWTDGKMKTQYRLNKNKLDIVFKNECRESHILVEEFMILANMIVAKRIHDDYPNLAILRCHPSPNTHRLKHLAESLEPVGIQLQFGSAGELSKSRLTYNGPENKDHGRAIVLNMLCAKSQVRPNYICTGGSLDKEYKNYALNTPLYTHFTSPIRRYVDIIVHRLLAASLNYAPVPTWEIQKMCMIVDHCNKQNYDAKRASDLSTELHLEKYILEKSPPLVMKAVVSDVREKYIDIILIDFDLNRSIHINDDFQGELKCIKDDAGEKVSKIELTWRAIRKKPVAKQIIERFSVIKVQMFKSDDRQVKMKLVRPNKTG